jgi:hypothetical protein
MAMFFALAADAQTLHGVTDAQSGGGTPAPPACSSVTTLTTILCATTNSVEFE